MANDISSELTIATAVSVLGDMLSDMSAYTLNIANETSGRSEVISVPVISTDDVARNWDATKGYTADADSGATTLDVTVTERIKPFHLSDNAYNKSPMTLQNYVAQNANEFGRYLQNLVFTAVDGVTGGTAKNASAIGVGDIKSLASALDNKGQSMNRHLVLSASAHSAILPASAETFGQGVIEQGRFSSLYGMQIHPSTAFNTGAGKTNTFACAQNAIVVVNRRPEVQASSTLEEYTPFEVEGLGIQCAYRRFYDATKGIHYGAFTTNFGVGIANADGIAKYKNT
jgi:hypothetical protein